VSWLRGLRERLADWLLGAAVRLEGLDMVPETVADLGLAPEPPLRLQPLPVTLVAVAAHAMPDLCEWEPGVYWVRRCGGQA
jgi:hypothetical protein